MQVVTDSFDVAVEGDQLAEKSICRGGGHCNSIWIADIGGLELRDVIAAPDGDLRLLVSTLHVWKFSGTKFEMVRVRMVQATCDTYRKMGA